MPDVPSLVLIFSGLIAFVPNSSDAPVTITAYLLNGSGNHEHDALLRVAQGSLVGLACPVPSPLAIDRDCRIVSAATRGPCSIVKTQRPKVCYCQCPLKNAKVSFDPPPSEDPSPRPLPERPHGILPTSSNITDISWLVRLRNVDEHFSKIDQGGSSSSLSFGWKAAATCAFDDEEAEQEKRKIYSAKFIELGHAVHEQAVAEMVVFEATLTRARIDIRVDSTDSSYDFEIKMLCPDRVSCPVVFLNRPVAMGAACNRCDQCIWGGHFLEYWKLTGKGYGGGALPRRECGQSTTLAFPRHELCPDYEVAGIPKNTRDRVLLSTLRRIKTVGDRIICPMGLIEP